MRTVAIGLVGLLLVVGGALLWQHLRYLDWRRNVVHDQQPLLYRSEAFHVATLVRVEAGGDLIEALAKTRAELEGQGDGLWVYAGQTAFYGRHSDQLGEHLWDGFVLVQYSSREAYDALAASPAYAAAWGRFAETYEHGMKRPAGLNLALPGFLLGMRVTNALRGSSLPDTTTRADEALLRERGFDPEARFARVDAARAVDPDALVVFNLILEGTAEQKAADAKYGAQMMGVMAARGHGPAHMGQAVTIRGQARFDNIAIVYYPGVDYFTTLIQSAFFQGIVGDKQLGDTLSMPTVPILNRL